jgi:hypothetical protein
MTTTPEKLGINRPLKLILGISLFLTLGAFLQLFSMAWTRQLLFTSTKWQLGLSALALVTLAEFIAVRFAIRGESRISQWWTRTQLGLARLGFLRIPLTTLLIALPAILFLHVDEAFLSGLVVRLLICWILILAVAELLLTYRQGWRWFVAAAGAGIIIGIAYRLGLLAQEISTYPFSLGWSEASRYYYASLYFSEGIYGFRVPPSVLHPSRYLLQSIPFLFGKLPLVLHRAWQVVLWISTTAVSGYLLARRVGVRRGGSLAAFIALGVLYLFQGPVYYHLLVMVILILWLFDGTKPWRSLFMILLASAWAGISRINWYPVPALLGAALYLLETSKGQRKPTEYLKWPVIWTILGAATASLAQLAYISWSGQPGGQFSSSFSSDLLWYRLLPNLTYPMGVLLAVFTASFPALLLVWLIRKGLQESLSWPRYLGLAAICLVLLAGGLVVSVKIGGGSNLHNLDAYLVVLGVVAAYLYFGKVRSESGALLEETVNRPYLLPIFVAVPLIFTLNQGGPVHRADQAGIDESLRAVREASASSIETGRPILFISQRHLLTFDLVEGVELVPDYETVFLMEMAMAGNEMYLKQFREDLGAHRFGWIVVDPLTTAFQGRAHSFGEENDAWVKEVSLPVLCYYEAAQTFGDPPLQILTPIDDPAPCP